MISYRTGSQNSSAYGRIIIAVPFINFNDSIAAALVEAPRRTLNTDEFAKSVSFAVATTFVVLKVAMLPSKSLICIGKR